MHRNRSAMAHYNIHMITVWGAQQDQCARLQGVQPRGGGGGEWEGWEEWEGGGRGGQGQGLCTE
jgi:hypothetical protein